MPIPHVHPMDDAVDTDQRSCHRLLSKYAPRALSNYYFDRCSSWRPNVRKHVRGEEGIVVITEQVCQDEDRSVSRSIRSAATEAT